MRGAVTKNDIIQSLQKEILTLQGHRRRTADNLPYADVGPIQSAFPEGKFPIGAVHEFISQETEDAAATIGFIAGITGQLMNNSGTTFWIGAKRTIFPPALKIFGIRPQRIIFIELARPKECLWAIEEVLKCKSVAAVIGEVSDLGFAESRRLQLAVENSNVTGFIHRFRPRSLNPVACVTRWMITQLPSEQIEIPGVGIPRWNIELSKVRNGRPGTWQVEWLDKGFHAITQPVSAPSDIHRLKTG
jgi:protein ImuA